MKLPQQKDREPKSPQKAAKKYSRLIRYSILGSLILLGLAILGFVALRVGNFAAGHDSTVDKPITDVLTMADQHRLKSVLISGNEVLATGLNGQKYHAFKEDGQTVTDIFRHDGVTVTIDNGQADQWAQAVLDLFLVALIVGREAKMELEEIVDFLKQPSRFTDIGARIPKGVLLVGAPGTGKTLISRAVAGEAGVSFFSVSGSEFVEMLVGVGAARVRDLFKEAKEHAPCIVFIDEIDAVGRQRNGSGTGGNDEREQTLNQLLVEMDGFDKQTNVVVIAATNRPDVLDSALLRPGRFDRQVMLDKPDIRGRLAILEVHARGKPLENDVALVELARQTAGFSGADLANLLNEAALLTARRGKLLISMPELEESILRVMAGPERKSRLITEAEKSIIAYHEVGHAIVMRSMPGADPVRKVQAIARGMALGITVQSPTEDRYLMRRSELLAKMAGAMGGRAAEELIFGDITTGASQDIEYVTNIAHRMVCEFGMSPLGNVAFKAEADGSTSISAETAAKIDQEIARLIEEAHTTALDILRERKDRLIAISEYLIQVETIDGEELDAMLFAA